MAKGAGVHFVVNAEGITRESIQLIEDFAGGSISGGFLTSDRHMGNKEMMVMSGVDVELLQP